MRLAIFDLDGTVTRHDTLVPYLRGWLRRHRQRRWRLAALAALLRSLLNGIDRGQLKSNLIRACMAGAAAADVNGWSAEFAAALDNDDLYPGALEAIEHHRAAGDRLILLSASVDLYVPEIARRFGFHEAICTGVAWRDGRLDGALVTANRRAAEKRRCIDALRARFPAARIAAYANAASDLDHLAAVDEPLLVNAAAGSRRLAKRLGIPTGDWRNKTRALPVQSP